MKRFNWPSLSPDERAAALARPRQRTESGVRDTVQRIFDEVERDGAAAVERWAINLDKFAPNRIGLSAKTVDAARARMQAADIEALDIAVANVRAYHEQTAPREQVVETHPGVLCRQTWRPIPACALYAPGGSAPLFSTLIMLAAPARAAYVPNLCALTPPDREGQAHPMMIAAAAACGLDALWLLGGAQAIAALTFGAGVMKADKIFGPGNAYVAEAKRFAAALPGGPQIDTPAGPSELMVIADADASPDLVAADLLSQAEHDSDAQVLLISPSTALLDAVAHEVERQVASLPRAAIARASLAHARAVQVRDLSEAAAIANAYAPEHLAVQTNEPAALLPSLHNAGAIFLGAWSAETFGDYVCGPSHVLPTDGAARAWSGVNTASFMKCINVQEMNAVGAGALAAPAARLARLEGLEAHARAADRRALP